MSFIDHQLYVQPLDATIDPHHPCDRAIITHGHADHARAGHGKVLATPDTIEIMKRRYGPTCAGSFQALDYGEIITDCGVEISFHPAGHILGSAQVRLRYAGETVVCTGDYKTAPDSTSASFELVPCDIFITEATFGLPVFRHPPAAREIEKLIKSHQSLPDRPHLIGAYALGKAQRVIKLLRDAGYDAPLYLHGAHSALCEFYQSRGVELGRLVPVTEASKDELNRGITLAPPSALRDRWARRFKDPVLGFASGWMSVKQRAKQRLVELPLVISDHADWDELTTTIPQTGADTIWVTHGREDALIHWCETKGLKAEPLSLQGREEEPEGA